MTTGPGPPRPVARLQLHRWKPAGHERIPKAAAKLTRRITAQSSGTGRRGALLGDVPTHPTAKASGTSKNRTGGSRCSAQGHQIQPAVFTQTKAPALLQHVNGFHHTADAADPTLAARSYAGVRRTLEA